MSTNPNPDPNPNDPAGAGAGAGAGDAARSEGGAAEAARAGGESARDVAGQGTWPPAEELHIGDGVPRYGEDLGEIPPSGSEDSWSSQPHPGYEAAPAGPGTNKRLAAGVLIGLVALSAGVFAGYKLLTSKSPNGSGAAPWTAAVKKDGAVVQGINAQNGVGTVGLPQNTGAQQEVQAAAATCDAATGNSKQLTATTGTIGGIGEWAIAATPSVDGLKVQAAALTTAVDADDPAAIAESAKTLCAGFAKISTLPAMPDAAGSAAWAAGITAYADAANHALKGAAGDAAALAQARVDLAKGNVELNTLSARIIAAT